MSQKQIAGSLTNLLGLASPPVALAYLDEPPPGTPRWDGGPVPSACTFWRRAESSVFFASAEAHMNCPVGALTSGFTLGDEGERNLEAVITRMTGAGYLAPPEPARIPRVAKTRAGVLYGPLAAFPDTPDLILVWLDARQAMLFQEGSGDARWDRPASMPAFGRPSCAALPVALADGRPVLSFGCAGMRTFTDLDDAKLLGVVPAVGAATLVAALEQTSAANRTMQGMYDEMRAAHPG